MHHFSTAATLVKRTRLVVGHHFCSPILPACEQTACPLQRSRIVSLRRSLYVAIIARNQESENPTVARYCLPDHLPSPYLRHNTVVSSKPSDHRRWGRKVAPGALAMCPYCRFVCYFWNGQSRQRAQQRLPSVLCR